MFQHFFRGARAEEVHDSPDDAGPTGLVIRAEAGAVVTVEVFIELNVFAPFRVFLELAFAAVDRATPVLVFEKDAREPATDFFGNLIKVHHAARASRALDGEI